MRVCDCVTQSSSSDIEEEMAHLSGSRERTGRRKNMTKKMKVRVSALIMCAAMLISSMSVFAGYTTSIFGGGMSEATAILSTNSGGATAQTIQNVSSATAVETSVKIIDEYGNYNGWAYGLSSVWVSTSGLTNPRTANSRHSCGNYGTTMSCGF